jgi:Right handed beta helix region
MPFQRRILATLFAFGAVVCLVAVVRFGGAWGSDARAAAAGVEGTTYYVSPSGDDRQSGRSPARAWRTVDRVDRAVLRPGDRVLFQGGKVFSDRELEPPASGTARAPIRFASYGGGRAQLKGGTDVWIPAGRHDLVFANLDFTGSQILFASSAEGSGTYRITIRNASFHDTPQGAINVSNRGDRDWTITRTSLRHIGDSGIFVWGSDITISDSTITDTGWNPAITWGAHGIYDKGRRTVIVHDTISGFQADGVSLRSDSARVAHNTISGGPVGIAYFDFDTRSGTTQVTDNRIDGVKTAFYFSSDADAVTGRPPVENFSITGNVFDAHGIDVDLTGAELSQIDLSHNVLRGPFAVAVAANAPNHGGAYQEGGNTILGEALFAWNGTTLSYSLYRAASGLGRGDHIYPASN